MLGGGDEYVRSFWVWLLSRQLALAGDDDTNRPGEKGMEALLLIVSGLLHS